MKKVLNGLLLMLLVMVGAVWAAPTEVYAGGYISDVVTKKGDSGKSSLEKSNYQVILPSLRASGSDVWIGYKSTSGKSSAITKLVGDTPTSLHGTQSEGKSAIKEIYINTSQEKFSKVMPLDNMGSTPVVNSAGEPVVFETRNGSAYINTISDNLFKPYISQIHVAKASSKKKAVEELVKKGCQFFVDKDMDGSDNESVVIGYSRTADEDKAVTDIIALSKDVEKPEGYKEADKQTVSGKILYVTENNKYGNPLMDIDAMKGLMQVDVTSDDLVRLISSRGLNQVAKSFFIADSDYKKMEESKTKCVVIGIDTDDASDIGIVYATSKKDFKNKKAAKRKMLANILKNDEPEEDEFAEETKNEEVIPNNNEENENANKQYDEPQNAPEEQVEATEQADDENADSGDAEEVTDASGEDVAGAGAIVDEDVYVSRTQIIVLIALAIMIPLVTIVVKRKIENPKKKTKK